MYLAEAMPGSDVWDPETQQQVALGVANTQSVPFRAAVRRSAPSSSIWDFHRDALTGLTFSPGFDQSPHGTSDGNFVIFNSAGSTISRRGLARLTSRYASHPFAGRPSPGLGRHYTRSLPVFLELMSFPDFILRVDVSVLDDSHDGDERGRHRRRVSRGGDARPDRCH
jgi:hypothetical protein